MRLVLGIDPGTARMGYGLVRAEGERLVAVDFGVLTSPSDRPLPQRLDDLHRQLQTLIRRFGPTEAVVEELFFTRNVRTAIAVGQARGVALLACAQAGLPVAEYNPLEIKRAVSGYGRGDKEQVQTMVRLLLALEAIPQPDDAADALAAAICHLHHGRLSELLQKGR